MSYNKPILTEIYAQISFNDGTLNESKIIDVASALKKIGFNNNEFVLAVNPQDPKNKPIARIRCWDKEKVKLVQLSRDTVILNFVNEYLGWDNFIKFINESLSEIGCDIDKDFRDLDLHTIDSFIADKKSFKLGDWINCDGELIPTYFKESSVTLDVIHGQGIPDINGTNRQIKIAAFEGSSEFSIKIESTFKNLNDNKFSFYDLLERLHEESVSTFEKLITDKVRNDIMEGVKP